MIRLMVLTSGLLAASPMEATADTNDRLPSASVSPARRIGDADDLVRRALVFEARGMTSERDELLEAAVAADPKHAVARALLGQVADGGRWENAEDAAGRLREDERRSAALAEYNERRAKAPETADAQLKLALWCKKVGLKPEAEAHLSVVTRLDPKRGEAWVLLGYRKYEGRWMTPAQAAADRAEKEARRKADVRWQAVLKAARWARGGNARERAESDRTLNDVSDPRAVPAVLKVFGSGKPGQQSLAVRLLGQIDGPEASRALVVMAAAGKTAAVQREAVQVLPRRDPRDVVDPLLDLLRPSTRYKLAGNVLTVEREKFNEVRLYDPPRAPQQRDAGANGSPAPDGRAMADAAAIDMSNQVAFVSNEPVLMTLRAVTGRDLGRDREDWRAWWADEQGYSYRRLSESEKPSFVTRIQAPSLGHSCFAAGTPVRTLDGPRPIESIQVGDQVLSQDTATGSLSFRPVVAAPHNPPSATFEVRLGDESIVATGIHRFWVAGRGWVMARDLKTGDLVRTLGGVSRVDAVERDEVQPVYNLEVSGTHSFFVGVAAALVHDHSRVQAVPEPFDAPPSAEAPHTGPR